MWLTVSSAPTTQTKSHTTRNVAIVVVVVLIVVACAYAALSAGGFILVQKRTITTVTYSTAEVPQMFSSNVVNGTITVSKGNYEYYPIIVSGDEHNAQLSGSFIASGGSGNDIIVLIMDQTSFINWQNGHQASDYYNSGQTTTGAFSVALTSGTYYLVYSNAFSIISSKNVNTQASLDYTQNVQTIVSYTTAYVTT